jgi:protein-disulfide isomerase
MLKNIGTAVALLVVAAAAPVLAQDKTVEPPEPTGQVADLKVSDKDFALGKADAPVLVVEYASLTCPHCASFHTEVLPGLKEEFVDTGKVRYIYRDFPLDRLALVASMVARCAGPGSYFGFIDTFFAAQDQWSRSSDPLAALRNLARLGGMSQNAFDACLKNVDVQNEILAQRLEAANEFNVGSTPTVFVNGAKYGGGMNLDQFRTLLNRLLSES